MGQHVQPSLSPVSTHDSLCSFIANKMASLQPIYGEEPRGASRKVRLVLLLLTSCSDLPFPPHFEPCVCSCYMAYLSKPQTADTSAFVYSNVYSRIRGAERAGRRCSPCTWRTVPLPWEATVVPATGHCCRDSIPPRFSPPPCTLTPFPSRLFLCPPSPHFHPSHTYTCFPS